VFGLLRERGREEEEETKYLGERPEIFPPFFVHKKQ
jgi:hypothetical protein